MSAPYPTAKRADTTRVPSLGRGRLACTKKLAKDRSYARADPLLEFGSLQGRACEHRCSWWRAPDRGFPKIWLGHRTPLDRVLVLGIYAVTFWKKRSSRRVRGAQDLVPRCPFRGGVLADRPWSPSRRPTIVFLRILPYTIVILDLEASSGPVCELCAVRVGCWGFPRGGLSRRLRPPSLASLRFSHVAMFGTASLLHSRCQTPAH